MAIDPTQTDPEEPVPLEDTFIMDQSPHLLEVIDHDVAAPFERQEREPIQGLAPEHPDYGFNEALKNSPSLRRDWLPVPEYTSKNSFGQALWNSVKRDSFGGNVYREFDQQIAELQRTGFDEKLIWDNRVELTRGISPAYYEDILLAPTFGLAKRESRRIREREIAIKKEHNTGIGLTLTADMMGFLIDPSNYLPGYGMLKGMRVADRVLGVSLLPGIAASSKGKQIAAMAGLGAFEEAIRMAPRYTSDPTFETNNYMEGIAISAAFAGFLPIVFGAFSRGSTAALNKMPVLHDDIQRNMHKWGMDVAVRQAMRFPGKLRDQGFKDPGTALRKAKEAAQDKVNAKVKGFDKTSQKRKFDQAVKKDMAGDVPGTEAFMGVINETLDRIGEAVSERLKRNLHKVTKIVDDNPDLVDSTKVSGVPDSVVDAGEEAVQEYLRMAKKLAVDKKALRRIAYDAAISAGDKKAANQILRDARVKNDSFEVEANYLDTVVEVIEKAKAKIKDINEKAKRCK